MKEGETMGAQVRAVGEGMGVLIEGNQEGIRRRDFEGGGVGCVCVCVRVTWGRVMWREL